MTVSLIKSRIENKVSDIETTNVHAGLTKVPVQNYITYLSPEIIFNFTSSTQLWVLGSSNGAAWKRQDTTGQYALEVVGSPIISGVVMATSPRLLVWDEETEVIVGVTFRTTGSADYPSFFKVRRATSYTSYDETPFLSLDDYGSSDDAGYIYVEGTIRVTDPGEEFFIVLEGSLGVDQENTISVREVNVVGALLYPVPEAEFFDFSQGLVGWSQGNIDGGRWQVVDYEDLDSSVGVPQPSSSQILVVDRYDIHSGVITIESPPLYIIAGSTKTISARISVQGSEDYPVSLRLRAKTLDGKYDQFPFSNRLWETSSGFWQTVTAEYEATEDYFQLVIECDLGSGDDNFVAIDSITITSS
ncbi:Concanavalin A-like lectin/glucanase domain [Trinorchestia longiramus]|nr:Concanavalin A-like lectin/glucanase domain [Trinorchestia longiramus]